MRRLAPCPACARHIAIDEPRCPMCAASLPPAWAPAIAPRPPARVGRAVRFAWRVVLAASATACGARTELLHDDAGVLADAGAPTRDAGRDAALPDAGRDAGTDAATADAGDEDAGDIPIYGAPPTRELPEPLVAIEPTARERARPRRPRRA